MDDRTPPGSLSLLNRLAYGMGDLGPSMAGNVLMVYFFFFLTTIAGLSPQLAGVILMVSNIWSAVSTLLIGTLSDRTQSQWGRRRIWMFCSAPMIALSFLLHCWVPPVQDWLLFGYYLLAALLFQTAGNGFTIPYGALLADLTSDPQEHVRLNGFRFSFSLAGAMGALVLAQGLSHWIRQPRQEMLILGVVSASVAIGSIWGCCWGTREQSAASPHQQDFDLKSLFTNQPLLLLVGIYALSWLAVQITPTLLPYFIVHCLGLGAEDIASIVLTMQGVALAALFVWEPLSHAIGKKLVYWAGVSLWSFAVLGMFYLQTGQTVLMYVLAALAGLGASTAYLIPLSMLPEVVDFDELQTGKRREGLVYAILVFLQKVTLAIGLFGMGQFLSWSGFQESIAGAEPVIQPDSALTMIRYITVAFPLLSLLLSLVLLYFYPITREQHQQTLSDLQQRRLADLDIST